jgi:glycerol-1-phosphate dehydrogenase [NAD(P)+]
METEVSIYCGEEAVPGLIRYCQECRRDRFLLVSDRNTHGVLGERVETALRERCWDVRAVVLHGTEVLADERRVIEVLHHAGGESFTYLAVGSGTVTDVTRYASHCARDTFISLPTAPSMDGYASRGAAMVMQGVKVTVAAHAPAAILADLPTLRQAPREMIAAGFGDMVGKYVSLADWELAALLTDEAYDAGVARRTRQALLDCVTHVAEIGQASATGVATLMHALFESGLGMAEFGSSRPASGLEHLPSHFWEVKWLEGQCPAALHGAKVGVGTVIAARRYQAIRGLAQEDVAARLSTARLPDWQGEAERIRAGYGKIADHVAAGYRPFLEALESNLDVLKQRIAGRWDEVQEIARAVPSARRIERLLARTGGPTSPREIGLRRDQVQQALLYSRYLRGRFTVDTLGRLLGAW